MKQKSRKTFQVIAITQCQMQTEEYRSRRIVMLMKAIKETWAYYEGMMISMGNEARSAAWKFSILRE